MLSRFMNLTITLLFIKSETEYNLCRCLEHSIIHIHIFYNCKYKYLQLFFTYSVRNCAFKVFHTRYHQMGFCVCAN